MSQHDESIAFQTSKIRRIMKCDDSTNKVASDAINMVAKAAEIFVEDLIAHSTEVGGRKKIRIQDVHHVIHSKNVYEFLVPEFLSPAELDARLVKKVVTKKTIPMPNDSPQSKTLKEFFNV